MSETLMPGFSVIGQLSTDGAIELGQLDIDLDEQELGLSARSISTRPGPHLTAQNRQGRATSDSSILLGTGWPLIPVVRSRNAVE